MFDALLYDSLSASNLEFLKIGFVSINIKLEKVWYLYILLIPSGFPVYMCKCTTATIKNLNIYPPFLFLRNIRTPSRTNPDLKEETAHVTVHVSLGESVSVENARLQGRVDPYVGVQLLHQRTAAECKMSRYTYWQGCGSGSVFNGVPGSGSRRQK
jgi:hypothetical protein